MKNSRKALKTIYLQVTKKNYDENKLLKTDYITYLYTKNSIFLVRFSRSSKVHYIVTSHFYMFSLALLT